MGNLEEYYNMRKRVYDVGFKGNTRFGTEYTIVEHLDNHRVLIKFETDNTREMSISSVRKGNVTNPMDKSVLGVACMGGDRNSASDGLFYRTWLRLVEKHIRNEIILSENWLNFNTFCIFMDQHDYFRYDFYEFVCEGQVYDHDTVKVIKRIDTSKCPVCGSQFRSSLKQLTCSQKCWNKYNDNDRLQRLKKVYGTMDSRYDQRIRLVDENEYTSTKNKEKQRFKCLECGGEFDQSFKNIMTAPKTRKNICPHCKQCEDSKQKEQLYTIKICPECGKEFDSKDRRGTYCSDECSRVVHKKRLDLHNKKLTAERRANFVNTKHVCINCGEEFERTYDHRSEIYCSNKCSDRFHHKNKDKFRKKRMKANGTVDRTITLELLIKKDNNICALCGESCNSDDVSINDQGYYIVGESYPSIDHIQPVVRGGTHTWDNVQLAHISCNRKKGDKYLECN